MRSTKPSKAVSSSHVIAGADELDESIVNSLIAPSKAWRKGSKGKRGSDTHRAFYTSNRPATRKMAKKWYDDVVLSNELLSVDEKDKEAYFQRLSRMIDNEARSADQATSKASEDVLADNEPNGPATVTPNQKPRSKKRVKRPARFDEAATSSEVVPSKKRASNEIISDESPRPINSTGCRRLVLMTVLRASTRRLVPSSTSQATRCWQTVTSLTRRWT